jgi:N-acetylmuramidase
MTVETADNLMTAKLVRLRQSPVPAAAAWPQSAVALGGPEDAVSEDDYQRVADGLSCCVAAVRAVAEVETDCQPFLSDGTGRPSILFEAHI